MLRLLVVVELAFDAIDSTMEQVDCRPEQIVKVGLKPRVVQGRNQGVEDIGHGADDHLALQPSLPGLMSRLNGLRRCAFP